MYGKSQPITSERAHIVELRGVTAYHIVLDYRVHVTRYEKSNTAALNQSNHLLN